MDNLGILIILGCLAAVTAQASNNTILCFHCNPTSSGNCGANNLTLAQLTNCSAPNNSSTAACYSEYLNYNNVSSNVAWNNFTGIHRGCTLLNNTDYCTGLTTPNVTRVSCAKCNSSSCNTHTFSSGGTITGPGTGSAGGSGAINIIPSVLIIALGLVISYIKVGFQKCY